MPGPCTQLASKTTFDDFAGADDESLVKAAKLGSQAAFGLLAQRHRQLIRSVALRATRNPEDADDVVQQVFLNALLHLQNFQGRSSFSTWLVRVTINESCTARRRTKKFNEVFPEDLNLLGSTEGIAEIKDARPNPEEQCSRQEWGQLLLSAMDELKPRMRTALRICDIDEYSTRETALILGITVGAVKTRLSRARKTLREKLKGLTGREAASSTPGNHRNPSGRSI